MFSFSPKSSKHLDSYLKFIKMCEISNPSFDSIISHLELSDDFKECTGLSSIEEYISKFEITEPRYSTGILFYAEIDGYVEALLFFIPILKELYRALEDRVIINIKSVNYDMFKEDGFNGSYGLILGPLATPLHNDDILISEMLACCISTCGKHRRYVALIDEAYNEMFYSNNFKFIGDVKNKYLMIR